MVLMTWFRPIVEMLYMLEDKSKALLSNDSQQEMDERVDVTDTANNP